MEVAGAAAEHGDKNGVASSSADAGGANDSICDHTSSTGTFYSGPNLEQTGKYYDWEADDDGKQWICSCTDKGGVLADCSFSQP
ncbi:MAG TPA: hypothetical protein VHB21_13490 [Minicystis sp.]|nr:hypothetical protein [Minicystis sp.]